MRSAACLALPCAMASAHDEALSFIREASTELAGIVEGKAPGAGSLINYVDNIVRSLEDLPGDLGVDTCEVLLRALRPLLVHRSARVRPMGLRACRHAISGRPTMLASLWRLCCDIPVVRSLERSGSAMWERSEAVKLVKEAMRIEGMDLPRSVTQALVALAGTADDKMRLLALETLRSLCIKSTIQVARCRGIPILVDAILDSKCRDLAEPILLTLLFLMNDPARRAFVRPSLDLQVRTVSKSRRGNGASFG